MLRPTPKDANVDAAKALERKIEALSRQIERFRIDAQRFLAGDLPLPPDELKDKIQSELRKLRNSKSRGTAHNFRLGSLEAKLNSHIALLGRRVRARELGETRRPDAGSEPRYDAVQGVVVGSQVAGGAAEALYNGLNRPKMGIEKFQGYLAKQVETIRSKTGCSEVQFRVAVQDGKLKLKAKPIRQ